MTAVGIPGGKTLSIKYMQVFCRLNASNLDIINELFVAAVIKMHDTWVEMNKLKKANIMQFNLAIISAGNLVSELLALCPKDIQDLKKLAFS